MVLAARELTPTGAQLARNVTRSRTLRRHPLRAHHRILGLGFHELAHSSAQASQSSAETHGRRREAHARRAPREPKRSE
jgi:hypothetical protein